MKLKITLSLALFLMIGGLCRAQYTEHTLINIGYAYQNQSFGELGAKFLFLKNDDVIFRLGASGLLGSVNGKFAFLPKIQGDFLLNTEKNVDFSHSYYFLFGAELTSKYIAPKIGTSLFGIVDLTFGYAFSIDKKGINGKELKGLNINFTINLPTVVLNESKK